MTTARVKHRDYVPRNYIAVAYCEVDFYGDKAKQFEKEWRSIKLSKHEKYKEELNNKVKPYEDQKQNYYCELKKHQTEYRKVESNKNGGYFGKQKKNEGCSVVFGITKLL